MPTHPNCPVYFTSLALENIRVFAERQELKLADDNGRPARWTPVFFPISDR